MDFVFFRLDTGGEDGWASRTWPTLAASACEWRIAISPMIP